MLSDSSKPIVGPSSAPVSTSHQSSSAESESGEIVEVTGETGAFPEESSDHQCAVGGVGSPSVSIALSVTPLFPDLEDSVMDRFAIPEGGIGNFVCLSYPLPVISCYF